MPGSRGHVWLTRLRDRCWSEQGVCGCTSPSAHRTHPGPLYTCLQDVESYDPVLNPVLNREVRRTGGRVLITLGDQDIDLSPSFVIFLSTRDPTVRSKALPVGTWHRGVEADASEQTVPLPLPAGGVPARPLLTGHLRQLHRHPQQFTEPVSQRGAQSGKTRRGRETL